MRRYDRARRGENEEKFGEIQETGGARAAVRTSIQRGAASVTIQIGASTARRLCAGSETTADGGAELRLASAQSVQFSEVWEPIGSAAR